MTLRTYVGQKYRAWQWRLRPRMRFPTYPPRVEQMIAGSYDPVRYECLALAMQRLETERIAGSLAEVGVYRGETSRFIHTHAPHRKFYLFDTFSGFPAGEAKPSDTRFDETSVEAVRRRVGDSPKLVFRVGRFPETAAGLESETFALVMLDLDLFAPTLAALQFFYPRLAPGGYLFLHDYNSPESDHAISRAADKFFRDKPERLIELPDVWGSVIMRKMHSTRTPQAEEILPTAG